MSPRDMRHEQTIYLVAPSGHPNYGDEFILRTWLRYLARVRPTARVIVDCHSPGQAVLLHEASHPDVIFTDTMWRMCAETEGLPMSEALDKAARSISDPGIFCRMVPGIELLARADVVHLIGGGYINAVWPHHLVLMAAAVAAGERSGGRVIATGQGLEPVGDPSHSPVVRALTDRFDLFDVRDDPSKQLIGSGANTSQTGDDAWLGVDDAAYDTETEAAKRKYVFCVQSDLIGHDETGETSVVRMVKLMRGFIEDWQIDGSDVAVVEGIPGADRVVYDLIADLLPGEFFVPFTEVWRWGLPAHAGQTWISTRFHPHLLAAAAGAKGVAVVGHPQYYGAKHRSLLAAGSQWSVADISDSSTEHIAGEGFSAEAVEKAKSVKAELAAAAYPPIPTPSLARRARARVRR